jgi:hypothetical protein
MSLLVLSVFSHPVSSAWNAPHSLPSPRIPWILPLSTQWHSSKPSSCVTSLWNLSETHQARLDMESRLQWSDIWGSNTLCFWANLSSSLGSRRPANWWYMWANRLGRVGMRWPEGTYIKMARQSKEGERREERGPGDFKSWWSNVVQGYDFTFLFPSSASSLGACLIVISCSHISECWVLCILK